MPQQSSRFALFLFVHYGYAGAFASYASLLFAARGMSAAQIGILMSLIQVMRIVGPTLLGSIADHSGRRVRVLRLCAAAALLACAGIALGDTFGQLFVAMVVLNLFASAQAPLAEALMVTAMQGDLSNYGRIRLWGSIGFIVAVMGTAYLLDWFGVGALPLIAGGLMLLVLGAALRIGEAPNRPAQAAAPLWSVLRQRAVAAFFAQAALMMAAHSALYVYYSLYLERLGYGKPLIGAMWSLGVLAEVVFFYFQAPVFRRIAAHSVLLLAFAAALLRFVLIGAGAGELAVLAVAQLLHAASFGAHHSASVLTMQRWFSGPLQARGQALYISLGYGVGGSAGALFMALCWDRLGAQAVFYAAAALCVAGAGAAALSRRWQQRV